MNGNDIFGGWVPIRNHFYGAISMVAPPSLWGPFLWSHVYGLLLSYVHPRKAPRTKEIWRRSCLVASSAATCHMGSVLTIRLYEPHECTKKKGGWCAITTFWPPRIDTNLDWCWLETSSWKKSVCAYNISPGCSGLLAVQFVRRIGRSVFSWIIKCFLSIEAPGVN